MKEYRVVGILIGFLFSVVGYSTLTLDDFPRTIWPFMSGYGHGDSRVPVSLGPLHRVSTILSNSIEQELVDFDSLLSHKLPLNEVINQFRNYPLGLNVDDVLKDKKGLLKIAIDYIKKYQGDDRKALQAYEQRKEEGLKIVQGKAIYLLVIAMILDDQKILLFKGRSFGMDNLVEAANFIVQYNENVGAFDDLVKSKFPADAGEEELVVRDN